MIIDVAYFQGDFNIAQLGQLAVQEKLNTYIDKYEVEYLKAVLGYKLYKAFTEGLLIDPIDPKWLALRDGGEYTDRNGYTAKWEGLTAVDTSPITAYVYFHFVNSEVSFLSGSGPVVAKTENSTRAMPSPFQAEAWNAMVEQNRVLGEFILDNDTDYEEFGPYHFRNYCHNGWGVWDHKNFRYFGQGNGLFATINTFGI